MKLHRMEYKQVIPISLEETWKFFSSAENLQKITPDKMNFKILTPLPEKIYPGLIIEYRVSPLLGIPMAWVTEITSVEEPNRFVDEQRYGPYEFWHHQHHFKAVEGGTEVLDIFHYKVPFGILGRIANALFVKRQLKQIFEYRVEKMKELLG